MHTTQQIIDLAKQQSNIPTDYKLGVVLGLTDSAISNYRKGRSFPHDPIARRLADLAKLDAGYVLACVHTERASDGETKSIWLGVADRLSRAGAAAAVALVTFSGTPDAGAMALADSAAPTGSICILCKIKAGLRRAWRLGTRLCTTALRPGAILPYGFALA